MKAVLKYAATMYGELYVTISGVDLMLQLLVGSLDSLPQVQSDNIIPSFIILDNVTD